MRAGIPSAWRVAAGLLCVLNGLLVQAQEAAAPRPLEQFARSPLVSQVALSPDGQRYAALIHSGDETRIVTRAFAEASPRVALSTDNREHRFNWMRWVNNERLVVSLSFDSRRGTEGTIERRLVSVRFDGSGQLALLKPQPGARAVEQFQDQVVDWMEDDGRRLLLQTHDARTGRPELVSVDVEQGERQRVATTAYAVGRWFTDASHRPRVLTRGVDKDLVEVMLADGEGGDWRGVWRFDPFGPDAVRPLGFGPDPDRLYVQALHQGRDAVFTVDLKSPGLQRQLLLAHPQRDVRGALMRAANGEVIGIVDLENPGVADWWDPAVAELARSIEPALPGRLNRVGQFSRDGGKYLVYSVGQGTPGRFYVGDRGTGRLTLLAAQYPELETAPLAPKQSLQLKARDGLTLSAFLTRPARAPAGPLPLVLIPQQLPAVPGFEPLAAFLADRGLAVLQVNHRGTGGSGHAFWAAGLQRWGLEMQDDLADAVQWAVDEKLADPKRVCIVGAGFGGYAALMGAVKTPDLFRCAASLGGLFDLFDHYDRLSKFRGGKALLEAQLGQAWQDRERLRATSPALQAARIQAPVLLVHGTLDRTVPVEQSRSMAAALSAAGKTHQLLELTEADHALSRQSHRVAYYQALEAFLRKHLAP